MPLIKCPNCGNEFYKIKVFLTMSCPQCGGDVQSSQSSFSSNSSQSSGSFSFMNSRGKTYYLHEKIQTLKAGKFRRLYYFSKTQREGAVNKIPQGFEVSETKSGLPVLKKK